MTSLIAWILERREAFRLRYGDPTELRVHPAVARAIRIEFEQRVGAEYARRIRHGRVFYLMRLDVSSSHDKDIAVFAR